MTNAQKLELCERVAREVANMLVLDDQQRRAKYGSHGGRLLLRRLRETAIVAEAVLLQLGG